MSQLDTHTAPRVESGSPSTGGGYSPGPPNWVPTGWAWLRCAMGKRTGCRGTYWVAPDGSRLSSWDVYVCSRDCAAVARSSYTRISPPDPRGAVVPPRQLG